MFELFGRIIVWQREVIYYSNAIEFYNYHLKQAPASLM